MTKVGIRKLLVVFLVLAVVSTLMPLQVAKAAGTSTLTVKVMTDTSEVVQGATVHVTGPSHYSTDRSLPHTPTGLSTNSLADGQYEVSVSLPAGYELQSIQVGSGAPDTSVNNKSSVTFQLDPAASLEVNFVCTKSSDGGFTSTDKIENYVFTSPSAGGRMSVEASADLRAGPFDIVVVLDYSGSMAKSFNDDDLSLDGHTNDDHVAKNHSDSRYASMEKAVKRFLENLQETSAGTVSFVFFSDEARISNYDSQTFHDISDLDIDDFVATEMRSNQQVKGATFTDLAFEAARKVLEQAQAPGTDRERKVVFFTDGEPGRNGFEHYTNQNLNEYKYVARSTYHSPYRIAAETYNQAGIIKGTYGQATTVNYSIEAKAPLFWVAAERIFGGNSQIVEEMKQLHTTNYVYYGAGVDPQALGYSDPSYPSTGSTAALATFYDTAAGNGTLSAKWEESSNWYRTTIDGLAAANVTPQANEYLYWDLQYNYNPNNYPGHDGDSAYNTQHGASELPSNFATSKHGNYNRTMNGLGAEVYAIGIIDDTTYTGGANEIARKDAIVDFLETVASPGCSYQASDTASLDNAFESIYHEIVGEYPGVYIGFQLDSDWSVYRADGTPVGSDESSGMWRDGDVLYIGPFTATSSNAYNVDLILYSRTVTTLAGSYTKGDPASAAMMGRATLYEKTGASTFSPLDPGDAWVQTITIAA